MTKATLEPAVRALRAGDDEAALDAALSTWQTTRDVGLGDAIEALGARFAEPLEHVEHLDRHGHWLAAAQSGRAAVVGPLLAHALAGTRRELMERIEALRLRPPDPRVARFLARTMAAPGPLAHDTWAPFWQTALAIVADAADPGAARWQPEIVLRLRAHGEHGLSIAAVNEAFATGRGARVPPDGLPALVALLPARSDVVDELVARVHAEPDDDGARHVLADALLERGDPRGELIALQLAPKRDRRRERQLLRHHLASWLAPLDSVVVAKTAVFERGFLAACAVSCSDEQVGSAVLARPEWATVRELALYARGAGSWELPVSPLLSAPTMRALRSVRGLRPQALSELGPPLPLTSLHVNLFGAFLVPLIERATPALPALRHLDLGFFGGATVPFADAIFQLPLVARLATLTVELLSERAKVEWLAAARRAGGPVVEVRRADERSGWTWRLEGNALSGHFAQRGRSVHARVPPLRLAQALVAALAPLEDLTLTGDGLAAGDDDARDRLRAYVTGRCTLHG